MPADYVGIWNKRDYEDFRSFGISFDFFYKTSSNENVEFVQYVFKKLYENGHIYEQDVIQFYCQFDDKFLPDRYVIGKCPNCGAENQYSIYVRNAVEFLIRYYIQSVPSVVGPQLREVANIISLSFPTSPNS